MSLASVRRIIHHCHKNHRFLFNLQPNPQNIHDQFRLVKLLSLVILGRENDVVLQIKRGLVIALEGLEVQNQVILDSKDGIRLQPWVVSGVQLRRAAAKFRVRYLGKVRNRYMELSEVVLVLP